MSDEELQEEEREVLSSIYEGDPAFKQLSSTVFQYKYGQDDEPRSFLLEVSWGKTYPTEKPTINMDTFYNRHILPEIKENIVTVVNQEAEQYLGAAMTYTLFEFVKEKAEELVAAQPDAIVKDLGVSMDCVSISEPQEVETKKAAKKEHLSKAQKRKQWDRVDARGEKPRGWDWVDVVKHLSQTGQKQVQNQEVPTSATS
ncbi:hypothetical protein R5R35_012998 [Gryllus longicercus]|uniref:RWD domain-containing protein n=1 Tax=Gryllus longicercus TaxID=2509291 RepID=A0AAN9V1X3_9ORTH